MTTETDRFEDRLLAELRAHVAQRAAADPRPEPPRGRRVRPAVRLGLAGAGIAAAAAIVVVATGGDGAPPAYAVQPQSDGSVTVTIRSLRDADGLERQLREAGVRAEVDDLEPGKACKAPRGRPASGGGAMSSAMRQSTDGTTTFTIDPGDLRADETLLITTSTTAGPDRAAGATMVSVGVVEGPVAPCEPVDAPAVPTLGAG